LWNGTIKEKRREEKRREEKRTFLFAGKTGTPFRLEAQGEKSEYIYSYSNRGERETTMTTTGSLYHHGEFFLLRRRKRLQQAGGCDL
jgi:hypothetical protein